SRLEAAMVYACSGVGMFRFRAMTDHTSHFPASGTIGRALLLGVAIALATPHGDVALGQSSPGSPAGTPSFIAIDLLPRGFTDSGAYGIFGGQQVGDGSGQATWGHTHALLWRGHAAGVVDLTPNWFVDAQTVGVSGGQQVGWGSGLATWGHDHALLWSGSAESAVDLHPGAFANSAAVGISGGQQVGWGSGPPTGGHHHALPWNGTAASVVDLHPTGFDSSQALGISGGRQVGWGAGAAAGNHHHALVWRGTAASAVDLHAFLPPGFEESNAYGIDPSGIIVGDARPRGSDRPHAFLCAQYVDGTPAPVCPAGNAAAPAVHSAPTALGSYTNGLVAR